MISDNMESEILEKYAIPQIHFPQENLIQKKMLARHFATLNGEEALFSSASVFSYEAILAGITSQQIEHVAKHAPINYKKELANSMRTEHRMKEVFEIAKLMDEDLGEGIFQNQQRVRSVQQYVLDNWAVFQF